MIGVRAGVYVTFSQQDVAFVPDVQTPKGFYVFCSDKGADNKVVKIATETELKTFFGEATMKYGKANALQYVAAIRHLKQGSPISVMRVLPEYATFGNNTAVLYKDAIGGNLTCNYTQEDNFTDFDDINYGNVLSNQSGSSTVYEPMISFFGEGRGESYNKYMFRISKVLNQTGMYVLDLYEKNERSSLSLVDSVEFSMNKDDRDIDGNSTYIEAQINRYLDFIDVKVFDENNGGKSLNELISICISESSFEDDIIDVINNLNQITGTPSDGDRFVISSECYDSELAGSQGYIVAYNDSTGEFDNVRLLDPAEVFVVNAKPELGIPQKAYVHWGDGIIDSFDPRIYYYAAEAGFEVYPQTTPDQFSSIYQTGTIGNMHDFKEIGKGSSDNLFDPVTGDIDYSILNELIADAFLGEIDPSVYRKNEIDMDLLIDTGFDSSIKTSMAMLVSDLRRDCIALLDNRSDIGENVSYSQAIEARETLNVYNSPFILLYEQYHEEYIPELGRRLNVNTPFDMATLIPKNDRLYGVETPIAGIKRYSINTTKLNYNPSEAEQDMLSTKNINYLVATEDGVCPMGQRTTQTTPGPYQEAHIIRWVLHLSKRVKRAAFYFLFDFNDEITWGAFDSIVNGLSNDYQRIIRSFNSNSSADDTQRRKRYFITKINTEVNGATEKILIDFKVTY